MGSGDAAYAGSGDYQITLNKAPGVFTLSVGDQGSTMTLGTTYTGNIYAGDIDSWTFTAGAGQKFVVNMKETGTPSATFTPWIRVIGPTGTLVGSNYGAAAALVTITAPVAGKYTIVAGSGDSGFAGSGNYTVLTSTP